MRNTRNIFQTVVPIDMFGKVGAVVIVSRYHTEPQPFCESHPGVWGCPELSASQDRFSGVRNTAETMMPRVRPQKPATTSAELEKRLNRAGERSPGDSSSNGLAVFAAAQKNRGPGGTE
jgi:hypothetical protein